MMGTRSNFPTPRSTEYLDTSICDCQNENVHTESTSNEGTRPSRIDSPGLVPAGTPAFFRACLASRMIFAIFRLRSLAPTPFPPCPSHVSRALSSTGGSAMSGSDPRAAQLTVCAARTMGASMYGRSAVGSLRSMEYCAPRL